MNNDLFFKDCFTEIEDGKVNAELNKATLKCFDSKDNKFSMDCEGNLVVNSIITREQNAVTGLTVDQMYPVGSIYMSVNATNPGTLFGGTWISWGNGKVPVGIDTTQTEFNTVEKTGGEKNHTLTINEMPQHNHKIIMNDTGGHGWCAQTAQTGSGNGYDGYCQMAGNSQSHNNLQPYITCYMWKRVA